jgi:hypothetical protein
MAFGVENGPLTYQHVVNKTFREYIDLFMKIFWDDFIIFIIMDTYHIKLRLYFLKYHEFDISLNPDKCAFMVFFGLILGFIVSKEENVMI